MRSGHCLLEIYFRSGCSARRHHPFFPRVEYPPVKDVIVCLNESIAWLRLLSVLLLELIQSSEDSIL